MEKEDLDELMHSLISQCHTRSQLCKLLYQGKADTGRAATASFSSTFNPKQN